jgi:hypothetical protein
MVLRESKCEQSSNVFGKGTSDFGGVRVPEGEKGVKHFIAFERLMLGEQRPRATPMSHSTRLLIARERLMHLSSPQAMHDEQRPSKAFYRV